MCAAVASEHDRLWRAVQTMRRVPGQGHALRVSVVSLVLSSVRSAKKSRQDAPVASSSAPEGTEALVAFSTAQKGKGREDSQVGHVGGSR